jgi:hypothetical protein
MNCVRDAERRQARASCVPVLHPYHEIPSCALDARAANPPWHVFRPPLVRVAALGESHHASSALHFPVQLPLEGLTLGLASGECSAAPQPTGTWPAQVGVNSRCHASLARILGSCRFVVQEALQNADYDSYQTQVLPRLVWHPLVSARPLVRQRIEGQVERQQQRNRAAAYPLLADIGPGAAIQGLFDASIMLEDSAFRDFVGAFCKLGSRWTSCRVALMWAVLALKGVFWMWKKVIYLYSKC